MSQTQRLFMAGLVIFMLGLQLRVVDRFILSERATSLVNRHFPSVTASSKADTLVAYEASDFDLAVSAERRSIRPPEWLGWSLMSVGTVLILTCPVFRV
ncbi:MAG: hypothetical protein O2931_05945 [Planctomycetota bacterium]|nr:hypothetical protein [Planctomycetota bacterium]MDA1178326.1 hypothetical protein [Planctomycetota bacterium]